MFFLSVNFCHKETYDDIIQRLVHFYKEHKERNKK